MLNFKGFFKKQKQKINLLFQSGFIWFSMISGLVFTGLIIWGIIYFFQQAFTDGFL
ncbi:hypothetical protein [Mesomycoplasma hyopneumoniae]|uniref:Uncharacterized protein n=1 Tax=Mesomycoplasma hyopneumoniae (strain 232) TaxID=295358 RepID=Q600S1_MESH2|nr:hypothetical protein [Mesomycoplasma hyopneumoniae]AAV27548.1 hypothetical protein mhp383 [Mesomycoplasma hyopneumoniae 232]QLG43470.1 hypothetical protein HZK19_01995 [Mesomycoplasma hyopneumoniae]UIF66785.1 hypothetical protein KUD10_02085 [Mesomycoplasma hyopneumoniae]